MAEVMPAVRPRRKPRAWLKCRAFMKTQEIHGTLFLTEGLLRRPQETARYERMAMDMLGTIINLGFALAFIIVATALMLA
ncbi:MAG: hypothetical protein ACK5LJ_16375 [Paracoccus sp. (in: a-proteobacteria)]